MILWHRLEKSWDEVNCGRITALVGKNDNECGVVFCREMDSLLSPSATIVGKHDELLEMFEKIVKGLKEKR